MSAQSVESILSRAMSDAAYGDLLFADPDRALADFELTAEETAKLKSLSRTEFNMLMSSPEERKSFGITTPGGGWDANHNETTLYVR